MKQGDFTNLAKNYKYRSGYSIDLIKAIVAYIGGLRSNFIVADVGAGTGKLTEQLSTLGLNGFAVEPNDSMRNEGINNTLIQTKFNWSNGSAEETGLEDCSVDWVVMASSFHWTDSKKALNEFYRILRPGGFLTVMWNPRDIKRSKLEQEIELFIEARVPNLKRVSSGAKKYTDHIDEVLISTGHFEKVLFMESPHEFIMSKDRYLGIWKSVNDVRAQAGEDLFEIILSEINKKIENQKEVIVPYKTRAWTVQRKA